MRHFLWLILFGLLIAPPPASLQAQSPHLQRAQYSGNPSARVWVNTKSGVYHCPGTRWYGATQQGEYMTQKQAQDKGYRPAYGKVCQ